MKKLIAIVIGGGLLFVIGSRVYDARQAQNVPTKGKKGGGGRPVSVLLSKVALGEVSEELTLTGALKPKELVDVNPKSQGRVERIYYEVGDRINQGELIGELEDDELQQRVRRAGEEAEVARERLGGEAGRLEHEWLADLDAEDVEVGPRRAPFVMRPFACMTAPSTLISPPAAPPSAVISPPICRRSVDLPEPEAPMRATISPS